MKKNNKPTINLGGIIKHTGGGYGFKLTFDTVEQANKYKDMIRWILVSDNYPVRYNIAYYDLKQYREK